MDTLPSAEIAQIAEFAEARAMADLQQALPSALVAGGGRLAHVGSAVALILPPVPHILFNRVIGLGLAEPASEAQLDAILELYPGPQRLVGVQLSPAAQPAALPAWLAARGFAAEGAWAKFVRGGGAPSAPPPAAPTDLWIAPIGPDYAPAFGTIAGTVFQMPEPIATWLAASIGRPGWQHYLAFDGDQPVAAGALYIADGIGWLGLGGTLPTHRRRGAQGAILARRIADAIALGCRWLVVETAPDPPEHPNPSYHNVVRMGFRLAYMRPNYVMRDT